MLLLAFAMVILGAKCKDQVIHLGHFEGSMQVGTEGRASAFAFVCFLSMQDLNFFVIVDFLNKSHFSLNARGH